MKEEISNLEISAVKWKYEMKSIFYPEILSFPFEISRFPSLKIRT